MTELKIFLSGDVMTGRGIDQILRHPGDPVLYERWARSALDYVGLAEARNGSIPRGVDPVYVWGEAIELLDESSVDARIINLETAITDRGDPWPNKGIHYRMHPDNAELISAANIDCCVLANNHVLDWSYPGLEQTLSSVRAEGAIPAGAGSDARSARAPAVVAKARGPRVIVVAVGTESSGIDPMWTAGEDRPGVSTTRLSPDDVDAVADMVQSVAAPGDLVIASIHWGPNWGYDFPSSHRSFAHDLIDRAGVHVVHGHSSHHPLGIEVHRGRLILYGCGDLINDYEGISGHESYHPELGLIYLARLDPRDGQLIALDLVPTRMRRFRLERAGAEARDWIGSRLSREGQRLGTAVVVSGERLQLRW